MKFLHRIGGRIAGLRLATQMIAAFGTVLVLGGLVGGFALYGLSRTDTQASALADKWLQGVGHLAVARTSALEVREFEIKHSRTGDGSYHAEYEEKIDGAAKLVASSAAAYESLLAADDERAIYAGFKKGWDAYRTAQQKVVALGRAKKQTDAADISDGAASMAVDEALGALDKLTRYNFDGGKAAAAQAHATSMQTRQFVFGLLAAALLLGITLATLITRRLTRQLGGEPGAAAKVAEAVAAGDLTTAIPLRAGDHTSLMAQLQAMQSSLAAAVSAVRHGSESVAIASNEIAQGNLDLSSRTEQQASALQQTSATMDELGSTVSNNADNASQANQLALGASSVATRGGQVVGEVVETMKGINDASRKIADIIGVIDSIAFQTNILALNAAVEAARAGEQGRGFAVVAGEVRSLAGRSAEAAKEIKVLIGASVEKVAHGTTLVDRAGKTMDEIVGAIKRVTDIVGEISSASVEQSAGVAQVGQAISQMDQATQQNAALVEEGAAAAASLKQQADQLVQAVAVFKLAGNAEGAAPKRAVPIAARAPSAAAPKVERRGPNRATNVERPDFKPRVAAKPVATAPAAAADAPARNGTDDWESF